MRLLDDLPIYIVIICIFINFSLGIVTGIDFTTLMIRGIVVTVVFSILGFWLSQTLKSATKKVHENKLNSRTGSKFDVAVPPDDEEDLIDYSSNNDEFVEVNPAHLHKSDENE